MRLWKVAGTAGRFRRRIQRGGHRRSMFRESDDEDEEEEERQIKFICLFVIYFYCYCYFFEYDACNL